MTDERLDGLLGEAFDKDIKVAPSLAHRARQEARRKMEQKELRKEYYPFVWIMLMHTVAVLLGGTMLLLLLEGMKQIIVVAGMIMLSNLPILIYVLAKVHYKELESVQEEI